MNKKISIVIYSINNERGIEKYAKKLNRILTKKGIDYEIIIHQKEIHKENKEQLSKLKKIIPLRIINKNIGKDHLFYCLKKAKNENILLIDYEKNFDPEIIPLFFTLREKGAEIIITNRIEYQNESPINKFCCRFVKFLFAKLGLDLEIDPFSGIRFFTKEVVERLDLNPKEVFFNLQLVIKGVSAGYNLKVVESKVIKAAGEKKVSEWLSLVKDFSKFTFSNLLTRPEIYPFHKNIKKRKGEGFHYNGLEFVSHTNLSNNESAFISASLPQRFLIITFVILAVAAFAVNWHLTLTFLISLITLFYFFDLFFGIFLIVRSFTKNPEIKISKKEIDNIKNKDLPRYTIFCPLYKEWQVIRQFVNAIDKLDYPKNKLQVLLLLEENDQRTIDEARNISVPKYFKIIIVPHSQPKTKPKALNYGLKFAKGKLAVIYDAEDIPEKDQLKKAYLAFKKIDKTAVCVQAKLNYYNPNQNLLTKLFTAEYSLWFDLTLTGLQSIDAPIPLGGTSNHFLIPELKKLKGWDPFNVTEDCDLGIRLAKRGFKTKIFNSTTFEEANSHYLNWVRQRSRWIKGYIQTYLVHMRKPEEFFATIKKPDILTFQLIIGTKILSMFVNPLMWLSTVSYFLFRPWVGPLIESFYHPLTLYLGVFCLAAGNFIYIYYYMIGLAKRNHYEIIKYVFFIPFYWCGVSIAAWKALYEMVYKPHYWSKTVHGLHFEKKKKVLEGISIVKSKEAVLIPKEQISINQT